MTKEEIIAVMNKPRSTAHIPQYRVIYKLATGSDWKKCFCGNGFDTFYRTCKNYANALANQK